MKSLFFILTLFFSANFCHSETTVIDSLQRELKNTKSDSFKVATLNQLGLEYTHTNPEKALEYSHEALALAERNGYVNNIAKSSQILGVIYKDQGDLESAMKHFIRALKISETQNKTEDVAGLYHNIADVYRNQGKLDKALEYSIKAAEIYEQLDFKQGIANAYTNIAILNVMSGQGEPALDYFKKALHIRKLLGDKKDIAAAMENLASVYNMQGNNKKALEYCFMTLEVEEEIGHKHMKASTLGNIGSIYHDTGEIKKALEYMQQSLELSKEIGSKPLIRSALGNISLVYRDINDYKNAYIYRQLEVDVQDSILNEQNTRQIAEMEVKYDSEKKELDIARLEEEQKRQAAELKQEQTKKYAFGGGLGLVVIFSVFLFNRFRVTRKQKKVIEEQKEEVDLAYDTLEEKNTEIMDSIQYAKRIQSAILPPQKLVKQYLEESFILFKPKDIVAGDFYWMENVDDLVIFAAADCTGHGVPGAMVSVMCSTALSKAVKELEIHEPAKILDKTVELLEERFAKSEEEVKDGMDLALCCLNTKTNQLQYAGANNPLYHLKEGEINEIKADKQPIGSYEDRKPYTNHRIELQKGDSIYIFTDGFADQFGGPKGKKFKYKPFRELLLANQNKPMEEQKQLLDECLENWRGELEQVDDICVIGVRV